ncbi:type II toxin-antitoxin system HicA family toxin [Paucibacter sp. XJ19-41]|uniref:type II toxin-antitoxin system HicA family toxin n=1 Tax=Paucibacter sp. XJ19-41 TaxID=2927824 RepID=UPI002349F3DE|nr:type II toxin-antitoxin system HicA family toxin [Paucibacter sp. XJ19-41]MDC6170126.1 type II toxin-antitoxin system HicA family toxin [Paucibacter sp. XJ19-41]
MIAVFVSTAIIFRVNGTHRKTLEKLLADPVNGNIEWSRIESLLKAAGCKLVEGAGSSVTFEFGGRKMTLHRPHPGKEALRYRVLAVREFLARMEIKP